MLDTVKEEEVLTVRTQTASKDKTDMVSMKIWVINTWLTGMEPVHSAPLVEMVELESELPMLAQPTTKLICSIW